MSSPFPSPETLNSNSKLLKPKLISEILEPEKKRLNPKYILTLNDEPYTANP